MDIICRLDGSGVGDWPNKDLMDYTCHRVNNCTTIRSNVAMAGVKSSSSGSEIYGTVANGGTGSQGQVSRFAAHLSGLCRGNFLHAKMALDLIEQGHLVTKSSSFKVLPVTLSEIFLLHFNLRFASLRAYERVQPILCVCLASLNPMSLLEIYHSVNALLSAEPLTWEEFMQRVKLLKGLLVQRSDDTYMLFHPSFREWLVRREDGENTKFLCDPRNGHAAIALRLSRLEAPLDAEKTMELGHHILKAHLYKSCGAEMAVPPRDLQAVWVALSADDVSASLGSIRNLFSPNVKVVAALYWVNLMKAMSVLTQIYLGIPVASSWWRFCRPHNGSARQQSAALSLRSRRSDGDGLAPFGIRSQLQRYDQQWGVGFVCCR